MPLFMLRNRNAAPIDPTFNTKWDWAGESERETNDEERNGHRTSDGAAADDAARYEEGGGGGMAGGRRRQNWLPLRPPLPSFLSLFPLLDTEGGLLIRRMIINTRERGMNGGRERGSF